jgi:hypothetical protein
LTLGCARNDGKGKAFVRGMSIWETFPLLGMIISAVLNPYITRKEF